jgi:hypothetical protein
MDTGKRQEIQAATARRKQLPSQLMSTTPGNGPKKTPHFSAAYAPRSGYSRLTTLAVRRPVRISGKWDRRRWIKAARQHNMVAAESKIHEILSTIDGLCNGSRAPHTFGQDRSP